MKSFNALLALITITASVISATPLPIKAAVMNKSPPAVAPGKVVRDINLPLCGELSSLKMQCADIKNRKQLPS